MKLYYIIGLIIMSFLEGTETQGFVSVSPEQRQQLLEQIARVSGEIETLECSFVQRKTIAVLAETAESEGKMYYRKATRMRWEYLRPESYYFVMNDGKAVMKKEGETDRGGGTRIFGEIGKMILACISGQKVVDEEKFMPTYELGGEVFRITLVPKNRRMLQMMSALVMEFDIREHTIRAVEMRQSEDITRISFKDKKVNGKLEESLFQL